MKNNSKTRIAKKKTNPTPRGIDTPLMKGDLLVLPLGVLVALNIYVIATNAADVLKNPQGVLGLIPVLAIIIFGFLYAYKTFRRYPRSLLTRIAALIPTLLLFLAIFLTLLSTSGGNSCTGLFGAQTDCVGLQHGILLFLLVNPFVSSVMGALSVIGIISILSKARA